MVHLVRGTVVHLVRGTVVHLVNRQELLCPVGVWLCTLASVEGSIPSHASYI